MIGPNAILQMVPVLERWFDPEKQAQVLARAGIFELPDGRAMIPEGDAARLHRTLRREDPELAPALATEAGRGTADYILAHRIPHPVQWGLRAMPARPSAWVLSKAIEKHAWTFAGSGAFRVVSPWVFEIADNPLIRGEHSDACLCHWHAAVFTRLYSVLVSPRCHCIETKCGAMQADNPCRFELSLAPLRSHQRLE